MDDTTLLTIAAFVLGYGLVSHRLDRGIVTAPMAFVAFGMLAAPQGLGWFGPRGLASVLFAILILEQGQFEHHTELAATTMITVLASIFAHGVSAAPGARAYAEAIGTRRETADAEMTTVTQHPTRRPSLHMP